MNVTRIVSIQNRMLLLGGVAVVLAGCSGGGNAAPTTTVVSTTTSTSLPPTTTAVTTTTVLTADETTTTVPTAPVMPLTGMPVTDEVIAARPALVVKIDNHSQARPQFGLNAADIVFEENVENLTRFAAVFQSQDSEPVGPIRSGRTQDILLLGSFGEPLFAWSGGNANVTRAIRSSELIDLSPTATGGKGGYFRNNRRGEVSEHTLYSATPALFAFTPLWAPAPQQQFAYRIAGEAFNGAPSAGADITMDGVKVKWEWDSNTAAYLRSQDGKPHEDATLGQVNAANVVVIEVTYQPSPADSRSPEAQTIGTGKVIVFTAGVVIQGTWTRDAITDVFSFADDDGNAILLTPGRTWVELARSDKTTPLP